MDARQELNRISGCYFSEGQLVPSDSGVSTPVVDPATARQIGAFPTVTPEEVDRAVAAANRAQRGWWAESALHRAEALHEVASAMRRLSPDVAELMTRETGKPYKESADELMWSVTATDYYAELGRHSVGSVLGASVAGQMHYTVKEPMGVVVVILPANFPVLLLMWEAAAALAAGNAVIVKPSEFATLTTLKFMEAFEALPAGLVQCVTGGGEVGRRLVAHPDTHMVGFTGSVPTGQAIAKACAEQFKPCLVEASGNDAFIVMPSAPLRTAARAATFAAFLNCGQVCTSAERILLGRQLGAEGLDTFRHTKLVMTDPAAREQDFWWFPYADDEAFPAAR